MDGVDCLETTPACVRIVIHAAPIQEYPSSTICILFNRKRNWTERLQENFRLSLQSYLEFLSIAEQRAIEVSPDHKVSWQNAFRFQRLSKRRQLIRFEYLLSKNMFDTDTFKSIASIEQRLDRGWGETEETSLRVSMSVYREIAEEIEAIAANADPHALDAPRLLLEKDQEYRDARQGLAERAEKRQRNREQ